MFLPDGEGYDVTIVSLDGGIVATQSAVSLDTVAIADLPPGPIDTVIIAGGFGVRPLIARPDALADIDRVDRPRHPARHGLFRGAARRGDRRTRRAPGDDALVARGTLAKHWPAVEVDADPIYIRSQPPGTREVWTSAGVTAGIDLTLALVERDHSTDVAQAIARQFVMFLRRPGGQSQFAAPTWIRQAPAGPIQRAQELVVDDPGADHSVRELARRVGMSERHFVRTFSRDVGLSPARFVARVGSTPHATPSSRRPTPSRPSLIAVASAPPRPCAARSCATSACRRRPTANVSVSPPNIQARVPSHSVPGTDATSDHRTNRRSQ